jgi:glycerate-2-kinase
MNVVRRALSAVKGGGLARAAAAASVLTLAVSDVLDDDPATIGSGPTVPVADDCAAARAVLERFGLWKSAGEDVRGALDAPAATLGAVPASNEMAIVCSAARSVAGARDALRARGYELPAPPLARLTGDAQDASRAVAAGIATQLERARGRWAFTLAGETTVSVPAEAGSGGRNQHLAACVAVALAGRRGFACVAAGSDGVDGNSLNAGAVVDGDTAARAAASGTDLAAAVRRFDTASALEAAGDALRTGATGTNVGDLLVAVGG